MPLLARDNEPLRFSDASWWAGTWAVGAAIGVALGGYLTLTSGAGAPGEASLDVWTDLVVMPGLSAGVVFLAHLSGQLIAGTVRRRRARQQGASEE